MTGAPQPCSQVTAAAPTGAFRPTSAVEGQCPHEVTACARRSPLMATWTLRGRRQIERHLQPNSSYRCEQHLPCTGSSSPQRTRRQSTATRHRARSPPRCPSHDQSRSPRHQRDTSGIGARMCNGVPLMTSSLSPTDRALRRGRDDWNGAAIGEHTCGSRLHGE